MSETCEKEKDEQENHSRVIWDAMGFADALSGIGNSMREKFASALKIVNETVISLYQKRNGQYSEDVEEEKNPTDENGENVASKKNIGAKEDKDCEGIESKDEEKQETNFFENAAKNTFTSATQSLRKAFSNFSISNTISSLFDYITPDFTPDIQMFDSESDFVDCFGAHRGGTKFIDRYSEKDIEDIIRTSDLSEKLAKIGIDDWYVKFDLSDCFSHYGYLRSHSLPEDDQYIGFLIVQIGEFKLKKRDSESKDNGFKVLEKNLPSSLNLLNIRWFSLQNPRSHFAPTRPRLPGQRYPGTGLARSAFNVLVQCAIKSNRDGIVNSPEHFHNAFMYEGFRFLNPAEEGKFCAMKRDLADDIKTRGLAAVSWAVYLGFLRDSSDEKVKWEAKEQAFPLSDKLKNYFQSSEYTSTVNNVMQKSDKYHIIWEEAEAYCLSAIVEYSSRECSVEQ
jgi:hypothetical protein